MKSRPKRQTKAELAAQAKAAERAKDDAAHAALGKAVANPGGVSGDDLAALPGHLDRLGSAHIKEHLKALGQKVGGAKAELARRLAEAVRAKPAGGAAPAPPPPPGPGPAAAAAGTATHDATATTSAPGQALDPADLRRAVAAATPADDPDDLAGMNGGVHPAAVRAVRAFIERHAVPDGSPLIHGMTRAEACHEVKVGGVAYRFPPGAAGVVAWTLAGLAAGPPLPAALARRQNAVVFSPGANKDDGRWEREYDTKGFVSAATGGDGDICAYNGKGVSRSTYAHEAGHNLAAHVWGSAHPPGDSEYGRAQAAEPPVTPYGASSTAEDFADACSIYAGSERGGVAGRDALQRRFPLKYAALEKLLAEHGGGGG